MTRDLTTYRKATVGDIDVLTRLRLLLLPEMLSGFREPADLAQAIEIYFTRTIPAGEFIAYLAFRNGQAVGVGGMAISELPPTSCPQTRKAGCILNVYTIPTARRAGVAETILDLLIREARDLGLSNIHLRATAQGVALYRKTGFSEPRFLEMELTLDPVPHG